MSTDRRVVVLSLLWVGILVALSRRWLADVREYVVTSTHGASSVNPATAGTAGKSGLGPDGSAGGGSQGGGGGAW